MTKRHARLRAVARENRANLTPAERALWDIVRVKRLGGVKFVRQAVRPPFLPDFAARSERLIVELDGWRVLRIPNNEVMTNPDGVARTILLALGKDFD